MHWTSLKSLMCTSSEIKIMCIKQVILDEIQSQSRVSFGKAVYTWVDLSQVKYWYKDISESEQQICTLNG